MDKMMVTSKLRAPSYCQTGKPGETGSLNIHWIHCSQFKTLTSTNKVVFCLVLTITKRLDSHFWPKLILITGFLLFGRFQSPCLLIQYTLFADFCSVFSQWNIQRAIDMKNIMMRGVVVLALGISWNPDIWSKSQGMLKLHVFRIIDRNSKKLPNLPRFFGLVHS